VAGVKVRLDAERCTGHGRCYELAPEVFGEDERGRGVVLRESPPPDLAAPARLAERNCPERAISIED
jgi:ferredoxin